MPSVWLRISCRTRRLFLKALTRQQADSPTHAQMPPHRRRYFGKIAAARKSRGFVQAVIMKIHEYQGKEILRQYGVPTPRGMACFSVDEAVAAAQSLGGAVWVVKAQIHAGGRGKGGGVKVARTLDEVRQAA